MTQKRLINVDAADWSSARDATIALKAVLRPKGVHGSGVDAFVDSMVYGGMLEVDPPYEILVRNIRSVDARDFIETLSRSIVKARAERLREYGIDPDVGIQIVKDFWQT